MEPGPVVQSLNYKGTVFPWKQANIQPDTSGRVHKIYPKQGDPVKKDELLAELDTTTLNLQLKQAEAAHDVAKAALKDASMNLDRLKNPIKKQPFHLGCISPFRNYPPSVDEIKEKAQGIKTKLNFTEDEVNFIEKKLTYKASKSRI